MVVVNRQSPWMVKKKNTRITYSKKISFENTLNITLQISTNSFLISIRVHYIFVSLSNLLYIYCCLLVRLSDTNIMIFELH